MMMKRLIYVVHCAKSFTNIISFHLTTALCSKCIITPILQMRKSGLRKIEGLAQDHVHSGCGTQDSNSCLFDFKDCAFSVFVK